jgi:hypothetical protein
MSAKPPKKEPVEKKPTEPEQPPVDKSGWYKTDSDD